MRPEARRNSTRDSRSFFYETHGLSVGQLEAVKRAAAEQSPYRSKSFNAPVTRSTDETMLKKQFFKKELYLRT